MIVEIYDYFCQRLFDIGVVLLLFFGLENFVCFVILEVFRL